MLKPNETTIEPLFEEFSVTQNTNNDFANMHADIKINMESVQAACGGVSVWDKTLEDLGIDYTPPSSKIPHLPEIIFLDPEKKFEFKSNDGDILCAWQGLIPGEIRSQSIILENRYTKKTPFFIKAEYNYKTENAEDQKKVDALLKEFVTITITDDEGKIVYRGAVWGNLDSDDDHSMKNYIPLGEFEPNVIEKYNINIKVSEELDNYYSDIEGRINWVLKATGDTDTEYPPQTGDYKLFFYIALLILSGVSTFYFILNKRRNK